MARRTALASNPLSSENLTRSLDAASKLRSLVERGGSGTLRKQSTLRFEWLRTNPAQPRKEFDQEAMETLQASIQAHGILEPLVVRFTGETYEIICGERRFRAARNLGLEEVPVVVREASDQEAFLLAMQENLHRNDLSPLEEARAFQTLLDQGVAASQRELGKLLGITQARISQKLALLEMPEEIQARVITRLSPSTGEAGLTERHVRALRRLTNPSGQTMLADQILEQRLSVAQTEQLVDQVLANQAAEEDGGGSLERKNGTRQKNFSIKRIGASTVKTTSTGLSIQLRGADRETQIEELEGILGWLRDR